MTHAESHDLLLDLAYGELDPQRAAEVESHLESCPECQREKAALEETRRMAAPLRELEEPSPGFDRRILDAARAQAQLEHDGNVGRVIEVSGTVRPLGMEAAQIDAHGPVKARAAERHRPRWMTRLAVGGSVAAAAALALVVNTTLDARRAEQRAREARSDEYQIHVTGQQPVDPTLRDAQAKLEAERNQPPKAQHAPAAPPVAAEKDIAPDVKSRKRPAPNRLEGSGGEVAASRGATAPASSLDRDRLGKKAANEVAGHDVPVAFGEERKADSAKEAPAASAPVEAGGPVAGVVGVREAPPLPAQAPAAMKSAPRSLSMASDPSAASVESSAQQARHGGDYVLAASLYRRAAALRQAAGDSANAAWNLAHAVECLSASGQFAEARGVREELSRSFPGESGALAAARRALREVEPAVPAAVPKQ